MPALDLPEPTFGNTPGGSGMSSMAGMMGGMGLGQSLGSLFSNSGAPYEDAMSQYRQYENKAQNVQNPFFQAGQQGMGHFQNWLQGMQDPSGFINHLMGQYQESPWAHYQQQQAQRAGMNEASANGLAGSTPMMQQMQQNAAGISSQDMQNWLGQVLGINNQYGAGQQQLMGMGQNSANALTNMYGQMGQNMGEAAYGREAGKQQDRSNGWSGLGNLAGAAAMLLL